MRGFILRIPKDLKFCEDLRFQIWPKFAKINPLKVMSFWLFNKFRFFTITHHILIKALFFRFQASQLLGFYFLYFFLQFKQ